MTIHLGHAPRKMSDTLAELARALPDDGLNIRFLLERIGEHGLLALCMFLCLPFLIPVMIPGVSTVFGLLIVLISLGIIANTVPWLPRRLLDRPMKREQLEAFLDRGVNLFLRIERLVRPRLLFLSAGTLMHRLNGVGLLGAGLLLMAPIALVPLTNTLPALAILLLAAGLLQRDGYFIIAGYAMILATIVYFTILAYAALAAGKGILSVFSHT